MFFQDEADFWVLAGLIVALGLLVGGLVLYQVRFQRRAYLGDRLLDVCGGDLKAAHREIDILEEENALVAGQAFRSAEPHIPHAMPLHKAIGLVTDSPPCEDFAGLKPRRAPPILRGHDPRDIVCECGHGAMIHHRERGRCLHGECNCRRFSAIVVQP